MSHEGADDRRMASVPASAAVEMAQENRRLQNALRRAEALSERRREWIVAHETWSNRDSTADVCISCGRQVRGEGAEGHNVVCSWVELSQS